MLDFSACVAETGTARQPKEPSVKPVRGQVKVPICGQL